MDAEVTLFSKPEELIAWADTFDILLNPSIEDAAILLNYMEGHDFQDKYDSLKADERRLDRLFEKTCYAKEIDEMAAALVESFISHLSSRDDLEKAAVTVAEGIKDYSTGKRGR